MSKRLISSAVSLSCFALIFESATYAQLRPPGLRINRPAQRAPSRRLGRTGGIYTGRYDQPVSQAGARGLQQPGFLGAAQGMGRVPYAPIPQAFLPIEAGFAAPRAPRSAYQTLGGVSSRQLSYVSGLKASMSPTAPLMGRSWELRIPERPFYVPEPEGTAFHRFFGLELTKPEPAADSIVVTEGVVGALQQDNEDRLRRLKARAGETFKAATMSNAPDREETMWQARLRLEAVCVQDRETYVPRLLLVHAALEQKQIVQAANYLVDAVMRRPSFFLERPKLATYFGDYDSTSGRSTLLEEQMRANLQIGEQNPQMPGAYALQAYCAWMLKDRARIESALEQMESAERRGELAGNIQAVRRALALAIKQ